MELNFSYIPVRPSKQRINGLTFIDDNGLSLEKVKSFIASAGHVADYARIMPSALVSGEKLADRVALYKHSGIQPFISGAVFEAAYLRNNLDSYYRFLEGAGIEIIEISDGVIEILPGTKADIIKAVNSKFNVMAKVGAFKSNALFPYEKWGEYISSSIEAGAAYIIIEGGKSGISNLVNGVREIRDALVYEIKTYAPADKLVWEVPLPENQAWFVEKFGSNTNLASVLPGDALELESMRLGLHPLTLLQHVPVLVKKEFNRAVNPIYDFDWQI